jgi:hypothetical protein
VAQEREIERQKQDPVEARVVERIVEETEIDRQDR